MLAIEKVAAGVWKLLLMQSLKLTMKLVLKRVYAEVGTKAVAAAGQSFHHA